jgi:ubiquinone biosynthesis protein
VTGDYHRAAQVHFDAGYVPAGKSVDVFAQACRSIGEPILGKPVNEISIGRLLAQLFQITETFAMETQPQLLLLQKTMVTAEGVARSLDPTINFWDVARPTIEAWMLDNMGPEARLAEAAGEASGLIRRLPGLVDTAERAARALAEGGGRRDRETADLLRSERARGGRPWQIAFGLAMTALVVLLLLRF